MTDAAAPGESDRTGIGAGPAGPPSFPGNAPPPPPAAPGPPAFPAGAPIPGGDPAASGNVPYASWGLRVGGYLIDSVIFLVVLGMLFLFFRHSHTLDVRMMARRGAGRRHIPAVPFLITGVLYVAYGTLLCGSRRGQTVGMMAVGVRAVREGSLGVLGYGRALGRAVVEGVFRLIELLFFVLGLIWLLDMLFPLWDGNRQTLHDKVSGSVVLRVRAAG